MTELYGEEGYLDLLAKIMRAGVDKGDRTGTGTRSIFGTQLRFNLRQGFPLLTTKKIHTKSVFAELVWLINGETNIRSLNEVGVTIWDEWADKNGDLGPVYGKQWRSWSAGRVAGVDQLADAINLIKNNPDSRRIIVNSWNAAEALDCALPPCHFVYQFEVHDGLLSCHMNMRSADMFLGVPFNIASYAALAELIAHVTGLKPGDLIVTMGDTHIYSNHFKQVELQLSRDILPPPSLAIPNYVNKDTVLNGGLAWTDFKVIDYVSHPAIKAQVAV